MVDFCNDELFFFAACFAISRRNDTTFSYKHTCAIIIVIVTIVIVVAAVVVIMLRLVRDARARDDIHASSCVFFILHEICMRFTPL